MNNLVCAIGVLLVVATLAACTRNDLATPQDRVEHWRVIMPQEVPLGAHRSELQEWLAEREIAYSVTGSGHESLAGSEKRIVFVAEELAGDGWVCSVWLVKVRAVLDDVDVIERYEVDREGVCL